MENMKKAEKVEFEYAENKEGKVKIYFTLDGIEHVLEVNSFMFLNDLSISDIK